MAWTSSPRTWVYGELVTTALMNAEIRDRFNEIWKVSAQGDILYASSSNALAALGIGTAGQVLRVNSGASAPEWVNGGMTLIEEKEATGTVASFDFTSIPSIYKHLKIFLAGRGDNSSDFVSLLLRFNGDTGNYYDHVEFYIASDGTEANNDSGGIGYSYMYLWRIPAATGISGMVGSSEISVFNYASTSFFKNIHTMNLCQEDTADNIIEAKWLNGIWRKTAAINQITIYPAAGNFAAGSIASLYGLM